MILGECPGAGDVERIPILFVKERTKLFARQDSSKNLRRHLTFSRNTLVFSRIESFIMVVELTVVFIGDLTATSLTSS